MSDTAGTTQTPVANKADIFQHLETLFSVKDTPPDTWFEIVWGLPDHGLSNSKHFSPTELDEAAHFALGRNKSGANVYVSPGLRRGIAAGENDRATKTNFACSSWAWVEFDKENDAKRTGTILHEKTLRPGFVVQTGSVPHPRAHIYFQLKEPATTMAALEDANKGLQALLGTDTVFDCVRIMRLAGTVNYPKESKVGRGYIPELTTFIPKNGFPYAAAELAGLGGDNVVNLSDKKRGRDDVEITALLEATRIDGQWHNNMLKAVASMQGKGWSAEQIRVAAKGYRKDAKSDTQLEAMIKGGEKKEYGKGADVIAELNKIYAVLPIGGKTRVVKFGEEKEFPGRETIIMTQTIEDFKSLNNKFRNEWKDKDGKHHSVQLGTFWIGSRDRRQFNDGMEFMPTQDGDIPGIKLNLWRGFGFKPIKGNCSGFLEFMRVIICSDNTEHFNYLLKREALILQKRIRSEVALGLATKEEGVGKGFYEKTMGKLLGNHAMQITKSVHIIGKHNPHLESLLRLTADEALFVHNPEHRSGLFELITESGITIEPKFCNVYMAPNFLNISVLSNAEHFVPISNTARRFFIPTVSIARMQDTKYFARLQGELDNGGYEALLYHLLYEIDLTGFNVREVPQTDELRQQRNFSLPPLEAWWCELLESGVLWGSDPREPNRAVSNEYQRVINVGLYHRTVKQLGLYDQARTLEPRIKHKMFSDHLLGGHLSKMGRDNTRKVLRRAGWTFPPLLECRAAWEAKYPGWKWRNEGLVEWEPEEESDEPLAGKQPGDDDVPF